MTIEEIRAFVNKLTPDEMKQCRSVINGKIGKRKITPEQQQKMQESRKKVLAGKNL